MAASPLAAEKYNESDLVNIGSGYEISIRSLVELISRLVGYRGEIRWDDPKPDGLPRRLLDVSRARDTFAFEPKISLAEGLRITIDWYKANA
jgi:nucleoside-diphosphate-sugar epimerase